MRVFITGVTGFIGSHLARELRATGHQVRGSSSRSAMPERPDVVHLTLGAPVDPAIFDEIDAVVHAAFDLSRGSHHRNVAGTIAIAEAARRRGVRSQLFISSYSAHGGAVTDYGRSKLELEEWFLQEGLAVVRPGLVIGRGGLFGRLTKLIASQPVVPVVYPDALLPIIGIADLTAAIAHLLQQPRRGVTRLYLDERVTMRALTQEIRRATTSRALLLSVPYRLALAGASLAELIGLSGLAGADNLRALHANQQVPPGTDLLELVPAPQGLREAIDAAS